MKIVISYLSAILSLLIIASSCKNEEVLLPAKGNVIFTLAPKAKGRGPVAEAGIPTVVSLSIKDSNGKLHENIKLSVSDLEQGHVCENLELPTGNYQLTQFVVLDADNKILYASPSEGSDLAQYVTDPLPIEFNIKNESTFITLQVLNVSEENPATTANLDINLEYPSLTFFDSAYVVFKNSTTEIKQELILDNISHVATAHIDSIPCGNWKVSISYFSTLTPTYKSLETHGAVQLQISSTASGLISNDAGVYIKDGNAPVMNFFNWVDYYYYLLFSNSKREGYARLPKDPTNPFIEIATINPKWIYVYADRSFYYANSSGTTHLYQGGGAFEVYGNNGDTHDRLATDIVNITSFVTAISAVRDKLWNLVDCVIILHDSNGNELLLYHVWDLRAPTSGGG